MGESPTFDRILYQGATLRRLYYEIWQAQVHYSGGDVRDLQGDEAPNLIVKRMYLASPWEIVLSQAVSGTPYATAAAAGYGALRGLKYLLEMKKEYDTHRAEMSLKRVELETAELNHSIDTVRKFREMLAIEAGLDNRHIYASREDPIVEEYLNLLPVTKVESISDDDPRA